MAMGWITDILPHNKALDIYTIQLAAGTLHFLTVPAIPVYSNNPSIIITLTPPSPLSVCESASLPVRLHLHLHLFPSPSGALQNTPQEFKKKSRRRVELFVATVCHVDPK